MGLFDKNPVIKKFTNAQMYKYAGVAKSIFATVACAAGLTAVIKYKHKTTTERIEKELKNKNKATSDSNLLMNSVKNNPTYLGFTKNKNASKQPSFTGGLAEFLYNPIKNTSLLDGVITTTRLAEARPGERGEVLFKEG